MMISNVGTHPLQNPRSNPTPFDVIGGNRSSIFYHVAFVVMAEGVGIRSRPEVSLRAPARGPRPLAPSRCAGHPMKGVHPLQNPLFELHPL